MMRKPQLTNFISDINDTWAKIVRLVDALRHPNYPLKLDRQELHNHLKKNNEWMIKVSQEFFQKYSSDPRIIFNNYVFNNLYSIIFSSSEYHINFRFPYDLLVIVTEREHEMEFPFSPLITSPPELVSVDYSLSFDNVMIHLQSLLDSSKKHITKTDKDYLQGFVNYRKRLNENITARINPLPPTKSNILESFDEERPSTWGNYLRYYHESKILEPKIIINPLYNKYLVIKEYSAKGSLPSSNITMKFKLDDSSILFIDDKDSHFSKNENFIRKVMINTMVYEYEPKTIYPPSTYTKDRFSVEMKPVSHDISSDDYQIIQFYKFLNETDSLLEHVNLRIGKVEGLLSRKLPVKIAKIRNLINTAFQKGVLFYYPRINYINLTRKRLLRIKTSSITEIEEENISNMLKQFPLSVHFLGEKENFYFLKISDHQDGILHDKLIEYIPSIEEDLKILDYSYPEPDIVFSNFRNS